MKKIKKEKSVTFKYKFMTELPPYDIEDLKEMVVLKIR